MTDLAKTSYKDFAAFLCVRDREALERITEAEVSISSAKCPSVDGESVLPSLGRHEVCEVGAKFA